MKIVNESYCYDILAPFYDDFKLDDDYDRFFALIAPLLSDALLPGYKATCCDIGTGTGIMAKKLHNYGFYTTGIDISSNMIFIAQENDPEHSVSFYAADATEEIPGERYSAITMFDDVINCISSISDIKLLFHNIYSSLAEGGVLVFDLVGLPAFIQYMSKVTFFEKGNVYRLTWPGHSKSKNYTTNYIMHYVIVKDNGDECRSLTGSISEHYYDPIFIEVAANEAGFKLIGRFSLTPDTLIPIGDPDACGVYKIVYKFMKGGTTDGLHQGDREAG
ncbi:class I SAM-dependent methyltransferase [Olsenella sp. KGMB02461]|nr:class I SAM-dependent methyltransferase [Olsenella sp. KGMB02461]